MALRQFLTDPQRRWPYLVFVGTAALGAWLYFESISHGGGPMRSQIYPFNFLADTPRYVPILIAILTAMVAWPTLRANRSPMAWGALAGCVTAFLGGIAALVAADLVINRTGPGEAALYAIILVPSAIGGSFLEVMVSVSMQIAVGVFAALFREEVKVG